MSSEIQAVTFNYRDYTWTKAKAVKWLKAHRLYPIKPADVTTGQLRYRILPPNRFRRFITKKEKNGINIILGFP